MMQKKRDKANSKMMMTRKIKKTRIQKNERMKREQVEGMKEKYDETEELNYSFCFV